MSRDSAGKVVRKTGIMGVVLAGGQVSVNDGIRAELPAGPHLRLVCVWFDRLTTLDELPGWITEVRSEGLIR